MRKRKIRQGVPIPSHRGGKNIELLLQLQVGDCISVADRSEANGLFVAARRMGKIKLLSRTLDDGAITVWRVK
jgi:hypothetical protein